ncbi:class I adenylate-forming enzyme family protein [Aeromicrobium chenweiae]|uniref:AMP-dependent synthetase n=1 Tax=Aeromicrobium chenweiae TaxID=2079793 RepID=A0A2S0WL67_9ACTN|nr:AMP-binding protein [Aeromicrobium chenweiae]AWB92047.1 AMP-dependent synthetase [Aeromicrobium chenweiae]TGN32896.1 AMP-dependent synthetase [Aeromicrobium chenweiae]
MLPVLTAAQSEHDQRRVAGALADRGLTLGDRVVLSVPGSPTYVSVVLGASRSGIVPVPLDPRLTPYERDRIIADVSPALVIDDAAGLDQLLEGPATDLSVDPRCRPMHFTSGTTGRPKGVWSGLLSPQDAAALVQEERELWGFCADDLDLVVSPIYHSAPLRFAMGTILAGGSIAVLPAFDPVDFLDAVDTLRPTSMFCVPAHLQRLFAHLDERGVSPDLSSFRLVAHAGAPCPEPIRRRAHALFGVDTVWEFYGSTEGQFTACPAAEWAARPGTLGRARPGRVVTTDEDGQLWCAVPPWARFTYWNAPEKTAATWRDTPDGPAFSVGDLGRVDDGYVHLDSRREDLIISGGVNVYPAEVEAALEDAPGLVDLAVFGRDDERWGQRVCAAYVGAVDEQTLRDLAASRLSPPKRPKTYERLDALPRTATGKVRRTELSAP